MYDFISSGTSAPSVFSSPSTAPVTSEFSRPGAVEARYVILGTGSMVVGQALEVEQSGCHESTPSSG
jgi:hypothetical protein